jgi:hypothetical protein
MTDWNAVSAFLANVVAWPGPNDVGYVNLHYSMPAQPPKTGLTKGMGWPFRDVTEFVNRAGWIVAGNKFKDVWFCTSLQSTAGVNKKGKPKAVRLASNAIAQKAIWIDCDVKANDPKHYGTEEDALKSILLFAKTVKLPTPSAIVRSGGGLHIYWISKTPLQPAEWLPYASGLKQLLLANAIKCDTGLTTDIARILRVPGTLNHKYDPPREVTLAPLPLAMYDFAQLDFLKQFAVAGPAHVQSSAPSIFAEGVTLATFGKPHPLFAALKGEPGLDAGINKNADNLLDPFPIFRQCGFLREALTTGGRDYDQPLWMYSVLCSTFMENGNDIAHRISQGHPSYSAADTQALYDRKMAERHDRGIGYPSCATIQGAGCKSCASCPLFAKGKSPLNIRPTPVTATVSPAVQSPAAAASMLPASFELNDDGLICKVIEIEKDGELNTAMIPLFQCQLKGFWLQKHPGEHLNFTASMDKGFEDQVSVDMGEVCKQGFSAYLSQKRVLIDIRGERFLKEFFLSTIGKLRAHAAAQQTIPFGWHEEDGKVRGFAYGGKIFMDDGTERPCGAVDPTFVQMYTPTGTMEDWMKATTVITGQKRAELNTILLMAFASPLLYLNGKNTAVLSAYGRDSGAGKSSASRIGLSVWGHPLATKITERATPNSIASMMKTLRHLPFYWDEITDDEMRKKFKTVMHELDGGKEKSRMKDGKQHQEVGMFQLMLHYLANDSLVSFLRKDNLNTTASQMRVLEWEVKRINGGPGQLNDADAEMLLSGTNRNFGHMGLLYAKFLAQNHAAIAEEFRLKCNEVQSKSGGKKSERYWITTVAIMTLAAKYAKQLGLDVDPDQTEDFMYKVYNENIVAREQYAQGGEIDNSEDVLARYLKEREAAARGIWTNYMHNEKGRPPKPVQIIRGPTQPTNMQGGIEFRFAIANHQLVIASRDFSDWLVKMKFSDAQVFASMRQEFGMTQQKLQLLSGTSHPPLREHCLVLNIKPNTPLWEYMINFTAPEEKVKIEAGVEIVDEQIETGLTVDGNGLATAASVAAFVQGAVR